MAALFSGSLSSCLYCFSSKSTWNNTFILPGLNFDTRVPIYASDIELFFIIVSISDLNFLAVSMYNGDFGSYRSGCQVSMRSREPSNVIKSGRIVVWIS